MIELDGVSYEAEGGALLEGVSLAARGGEVLAVAGPIGPSKSTHLRVMAGACAASSDEVRMAGRPTTGAHGRCDESASPNLNKERRKTSP